MRVIKIHKNRSARTSISGFTDGDLRLIARWLQEASAHAERTEAAAADRLAGALVDIANARPGTRELGGWAAGTSVMDEMFQPVDDGDA